MIKNIIYEVVIPDKIGYSSNYNKLGIYLQTPETILYDRYRKNIVLDNCKYYELTHFLDELYLGNSDYFDLLCFPTELVTVCNPVMDFLLDNKKEFLTEKLINHYAAHYKQIETDFNALNNSRYGTKDILDFCTVVDMGPNSLFVPEPIDYYKWSKTYYEHEGLEMDFCELVKMPGVDNAYLVCISSNETILKDIVNDKKTELIIVPYNHNEHNEPIAILFFNKNEYLKHRHRNRILFSYVVSSNNKFVTNADKHRYLVSDMWYIHTRTYFLYKILKKIDDPLMIPLTTDLKLKKLEEIKTSKSYDTNASFKLSKRMLNYLDTAKKELTVLSRQRIKDLNYLIRINYHAST